MNLKDLLAVIEKVEDENFNMASFGARSSCGTECCLVGHYALAYPDRIPHRWNDDGLMELLDSNRRILGWDQTREMLSRHFDLTGDEVSGLFYGYDSAKDKKKKLGEIQDLIERKS